DHEIGALALRGGLELVDLALAEVELRSGRAALLGHPSHHFRPRRLREAAQLVEGLFHFEPALLGQLEGGEQRALSPPHGIHPSRIISLTIRSAAPSAPPVSSTSSHRRGASRANHVI